MLKKIKLKNFKCFEDIEFELGNVNLLAGSNGCGKSSFIQALLLLRQSIERDKDLQSLELYGHYINLGLAKDIIYEDAKNNELKIELWNDDNAYLGVFPQYDAEKYILTTNIEKKEISLSLIFFHLHLNMFQQNELFHKIYFQPLHLMIN